MAQKTRVPNPPKRSQGPQRRSTSADPGAADQKRRLLYLLAASGLAVLIAVVAVILLTGGGSSDEGAKLEAAGFTLQSFPALTNKSDHSDVPTLQTKPKWNSSPPTSGPHYGVPAVWDFYDEEVPLVQTVHNLEHGGVVIHYGPQFPKADVAKIRELVRPGPERPDRRPAQDATRTRSRFRRGPRRTGRPALVTGVAAGSRRAQSSTRPHSTPSSRRTGTRGPSGSCPSS